MPRVTPARTPARHSGVGPLRHRAATDEVTRLNFVAHLSSSGFLIPALYALDWLDREQADTGTRRRFWERYLEQARFTLHHGVRVRQSEDATTDIFFSYSGRAASRLARDSDAASLGAWHDLGDAFRLGERSADGDCDVRLR